MPNNKSAERRIRNSERKHQRNNSVKSRLRTLEKKYLGLVTAEKRDEAATAFPGVASAYDKAAKRGVIHRCLANRKKSRLAARLNKLAAA